MNKTNINNKEKFDPETFQPFTKVLVRNRGIDIWTTALFTHINKSMEYPYRCMLNCFKYCIPYNDDTKNLLGTTDEAPEYYRYWEE